MDDLGFIVVSYVVTFGAVALYIVSLVRGARRSGRHIAREERPWT